MPTGNVFSLPNMIRKLFIFFFRYSTASGLLDEAGDGGLSRRLVVLLVDEVALVSVPAESLLEEGAGSRLVEAERSGAMEFTAEND